MGLGPNPNPNPKPNTPVVEGGLGLGLGLALTLNPIPLWWRVARCKKGGSTACPSSWRQPAAGQPGPWGVAEVMMV